jgi:hypothetical protein
VIPPEQNTKFVCRMEDILTLYREPYDETPQLSASMKPTNLLTHVCDSLPNLPGAIGWTNYTDQLAGTRNISVINEPLVGWRHIDIIKKRTKVEFVEQMRQLVDLPIRYRPPICLLNRRG